MSTGKNPIILKTERLYLRPWRGDDAGVLYTLAKDPRVGLAAGWLPHRCLQDSRNVLKAVLMRDGVYALTLRGGGEPVIGCASLVRTRVSIELDEPELGYWLGVPFWGFGYMTEASRALIRRAFVDLGAQRLWCAHHEGNERSRRVIEKCGFSFVLSRHEEVKPLGELRRIHYFSLSRADWEKM